MTLRSKSTSSSVHIKELTASLSVFFGVCFDLDVLKLNFQVEKHEPSKQSKFSATIGRSMVHALNSEDILLQRSLEY